MGKKLGFGIVGLFVVGAIYYFSIGSNFLSSEIKKQVDAGLLTAQTHGFIVEERDVQKQSEHFTLSFNNPKKITPFLNAQGIQITSDDVQNMKGLKLGVDIAYVANIYSAVSLDVYPLALPAIMTSKNTALEDEHIITQITKMLKKKTFLMHIDINKLGTGFKGYVQDINESIKNNVLTNISLTGLSFEGALKEQKLHKLTQELKEMTVMLNKKITVTLQGLQSHYLITGKTFYDYETSYTLDTIQMHDTPTASFSLLDTKISSASKLHNKLLTSSITTHTKTANFKNEKATLSLDSLIFNAKASNLDISAFKKLQTLDPNNTKEMGSVLQRLISNGVNMDIENISAQNIDYAGKKLDDFNITAHLDIHKFLDIIAIKKDPLSALSMIDANLKLSLSSALFGFIAEQPKAMIALMLFQPKNVNGKKVYSVELQKGKVKINQMPIN